MEFLKSLPKNKWGDFLNEIKPELNGISYKKKQGYIKTIIGEIKDCIEYQKNESALDRIILGLYIEKEYFLENLKKERCLRHSKYLSSRNLVPGISAHVLKYSQLLNLSLSDINYFKSLIIFEKVYFQLEKLNKFINKEISGFEKATFIKSNTIRVSKIKSLLAINDFNFLQSRDNESSERNMNKYEYYSNEKISEAVSFLLSRYNDSSGFKDYDLQVSDLNFIHNKALELITAACKYKAILEMEIEIENFGYRCFVSENKEIVIKHTDISFQKSMEFANIQLELQEQTNVYYNFIFNKEVASLQDVAKLFSESNAGLFELKSLPIKRFVQSIPLLLIGYFLVKDELEFFKEELHIIKTIAKDLLIPYDSFKNYYIRPNLTFHDFIKFLRFFIFQNVLTSNNLRNVSSTVDITTIYSSLVSVISKADLKSYLQILGDEEKIETFLDLITWNTERKDTYLDLQYTPIIYHNDHFLIPNCLLGMSNLTRNIFFAESKKGNNIKGSQINKHTPIFKILDEAFKSKSFITDYEIEIKFCDQDQKQSDIDFLAFRDNVLFIMECKDVTHPTDSFEMRTTYNHFKKASSQLSFLCKALKNEEILKILCERIQVSYSKNIEIVPIIVASNNKFWGNNIDGFSVRNVRELTAFMNSGYWNLRLDENDLCRFKLWKGEKFEVSDLIHYCGSESPHQTWYESTNNIRYDYGGKIYYETYSVSLDKVFEKLKKRYEYQYVQLEEAIE